jgi:CBS domain-containing protein
LDGEGKEIVLGFLGEGDCFGEISLLTRGPTTANIQTMEETVTLTQSKEAFLPMTERYPIFYQFFNQLLMHRMRMVYREFLTESPGGVQVEPFLYRKKIGDLLSPSESFCHSRNTIQEVGERVIVKGLNAMVVVDDQKKPRGIVHLSGIARSVLLEGLSSQEPVERIMERDFHSIDSRSYFFDALYQMIKHKTNELIVMDGERAEGVLTGFDLLRFRGREALSLLRNIEEAPTLSQLNNMRGEVEKVLRALMTDGALASHACKIVSEFNDKMVRRVIRLAEEEWGPPPSPYAWLGLGSEGRREQTLLTDQDNAIVFSSSSPEQSFDYFRRFSASVVDGLSQCGIPLCKGGVMASNPKYFGDIEQWRLKTEGWVRTSVLEEKELMDTYVFLDFRSVCGEPALAKELKSHLIERIHEHPSFLKSLAQPMVSIPIPIGFFKNFIVEKSGKYKNRLNIKLHGLVPLITCIKILALHKGIAETNTLERISALNQDKVISNDQREGLDQALETFLTLKIRNNLNDLDQGRELSNHIDPTELSTRQKQLLKEAFWAVSELQKTTRNLLNVKGEDEGYRL